MTTLPTTVIIGADAFFGGCLAARLLQTSADHVWWMADFSRHSEQVAYERFVVKCFERSVFESTFPELGTRLRITALQADDADANELDRSAGLWCVKNVWVIPGGDGTHARFSHDRLLAIALRFAPAVLNWVTRPFASQSDAGDEHAWRSTTPVVCRTFRTGLLVDPAADADDPADDLSAIVAPFHDVIDDVRARFAPFLDRYPLRVAAVANRPLYVDDVGRAIDAMLTVANRDDSVAAGYLVRGSSHLTIDDVCRAIGRAYNVTIVPSCVDDQMNAVDRLLAEHLRSIDAIFGEVSEHATVTPLTPLPPDGSAIDAGTLAQLAVRACANHADARRTREAGIRATIARLESRTIAVGHGSLTYFRGGSSGPALILLNAFGQDLDYWHPLIDLLAPRHRIFIWETRGLRDVDRDVSLTLEDHVGDVEAVVRAEGLRSCYLVGWCNGPQVALEVWHRSRVTVDGLVFLNCAFNLPEHLQLDNPYNLTMESLCRTIVADPRVAGPMARMVRAMAAPNEAELSSRTEQVMSDAVVRLTRKELRPHVTRPFESVDSTRRYAAQMVDLLAHDTLAHAAAVDVPVLVVGCDRDQVVSPDRARRIAGMFRDSRYLQLSGTHHTLYEQPGRVAGIITGFVNGYKEDRMTPEINQGAPSAAGAEVPRTVAIITNNTNCERHVQYYTTLEKYFMVNGWVIGSSFDVDMVVISGCGFHNMMLEKVKKLLTDLDTAQFNGELVMTGCIPTTHREEWKKGFKGALVELSGEAALDGIINATVPFKALQPANVLKLHDDTIADEENKVLHVKVADGCIRQCSFCVIHKAKGRIRSFSADSLYHQIDAGVRAGYKTIFLMGEDTFAYGTDRGETIIEFLTSVLERHPHLRFQFGNLDHRWLVEYLDDIIRLCQRGVILQLHVGMQHIDDHLLVRMGRGGIPFERIYDAIVKLKTACPDLYLGVDVIVGFPGETEEMFKRLTEFFETEPHIDNVQHNGYSAIAGAPAAEFEDQVTPSVIAARWYRLTRVLQKRTAFNRTNQHSNFDITFRETRDLSYMFVKDSVIDLPAADSCTVDAPPVKAGGRLLPMIS